MRRFFGGSVYIYIYICSIILQNIYLLLRILTNIFFFPESVFKNGGTYKVRNEIETKRNQRKRNETK
jgi:hypothetical protein